MSDMTPAGNTGGDTTTPIAAALADLPAKIRVHALAEALGVLAADPADAQAAAAEATAPEPTQQQDAPAAQAPVEAPAQPAPATQSAPRVAGIPGFSEPAPRTPVAEPSQTAARVIPPT